MYKKRKVEKRYIILIALIIIAVFLGIISNIVNDNRNLIMLEKVTKDSILFINKIIYKPIELVSNIIEENKEKNNVYAKYKDLQKKASQIELNKARIIELEHEVDTLKKTLELNKTLSENSYLNAGIVNRNIGYWYDTITIDKGSHNGVKKNMAVIVNEGLIGKIIKTSNFNSTVKLLTTDQIKEKISVKIIINGKSIYGLLSRYDKNKRVFIVEGISENTDIKEGSLVTTTGMGDIFPSGILIGKVKKIRTDNFDLAKIVEVESEVNFDDISVVTILKRKED